VTKLGVIPSDRPILETDMPDRVHAQCQPDGMNGPWNKAHAVSFNAPGTFLCVGASSGYSSTFGLLNNTCCLSHDAATLFPGARLAIGRVYANYSLSHELVGYATSQGTIAPGNVGQTLYLLAGILGNTSDPNDYAGIFVLNVETGS
jgi:hypothetical protein